MALVDNELMVNAIADVVIDALEANRELDGVKVFIRGEAPFVMPQDKYPYSEVIVGEETPETPQTGGLYECHYSGLIAFAVQLTTQANADWLEIFSDRRAKVRSYDLIKRLVMAAQAEMQRAVHHDLNDLHTTITLNAQTITESVVKFYLEGPILYLLEDRTDNYENSGSISFKVTTERTVTE